MCCTYLAPRRARVGTCLSAAVQANGTVVAGCSCATALAKLLLISALRAAALAAPIARVLNVVDDVSGHVTGACTMVAQQLAAAYRAFCAKVKEANLPLSRNKTKALATSKKLRDALMGQPGWDIGEDDFVEVHRDLVATLCLGPTDGSRPRQLVGKLLAAKGGGSPGCSGRRSAVRGSSGLAPRPKPRGARPSWGCPTAA